MELAELFVELPRIGREAKIRAEEDACYAHWEDVDRDLANDAYQALYRILHYYEYLLCRNSQNSSEGQTLELFMRELLASCRQTSKDRYSVDEIRTELWKECLVLGAASIRDNPPDKIPRVLAREICIYLGTACVDVAKMEKPAESTPEPPPRHIGWTPRIVGKDDAKSA